MDHVKSAAHSRRRVRPLAVGALVALACTFATSASAAGPKSGTYTGHLAAPRATYVVKLTVHGTRISAATINSTPFYCSGGGPPTPVRFAAGKIAGRGSFTLHGVYKILVGPLKGKIGDRLTLSGRFTSRGTVSGTVRTVVVGIKSCSGSSRFSAKR